MNFEQHRYHARDRRHATEDRGRQELIEFLHALRRGWWVIVPAAIITASGSWYSMSQREPIYTAGVLLQHSESPSMIAIPTAMMRGEQVDFASQLEIIRSRSVLATVVDSLTLQLSLGDREADRTQIVKGVEISSSAAVGRYLIRAAASGLTLVEPVTDRVLTRATAMGWLEIPGLRILVDPRMVGSEPLTISIMDYENALEQLKRRLVVEPGMGPMLVRIRYSHPDPQHAANVANLAARGYEDFRARTAREAAAIRKEFLANRLVEITDSLGRVQQNLLDYQQRQGSLNPQLEGNTLVSALMQAENEARAHRYQQGLLESLVATLDSEPSSEAGAHRLIAIGGSVLPGGAELYSRLQQLRAERNSLTASRFGQTDMGPQVEVIDSLIASTWRHVRSLAEEALVLQRDRVRAADSHVADLRLSVGGIPEKSAEFTRLGQQVDAVQNIFDRLLGSYYEAQIAEAVETGDVRIVDAAAVPLHPDPIPVHLNLAIAAFIGLMLGAASVGLRHHFDTRVKRADDAERSADLQILSMVPHMNGGGKRAVQAAGEEAFRWLASSLRFINPGRPLVVGVTSAAPGEGKSTVVVNLAATSVSRGNRVLLIDADFRKPVVHDAFGLPRSPGLTDVLEGEIPFKVAVQADSATGLDILTCGSPVEHPMSLLSSGEFTRLIASLRREYDLILLDTAPVLAVAESMAVCADTDGVLFAVRANHTDQRAVVEATAKIRQMKGVLIGLVLTDVPTGSAYARESFRYYSYSEYYKAGASRKRSPKQPSRLLPGLRSRN